MPQKGYRPEEIIAKLPWGRDLPRAGQEGARGREDDGRQRGELQPPAEGTPTDIWPDPLLRSPRARASWHAGVRACHRLKCRVATLQRQVQHMYLKMQLQCTPSQGTACNCW